MEVKLTKSDKIILKNLAYNPRIFDNELANKCNLSKDSIRYRIARLEKLKIIEGYGVFIDYTTLGYHSYKLYLKLSATLQEKQDLVNYLKKQKHVFSIFESHGNWDVATAIFSKTREGYYEFENKLLNQFGKIISSRKFCLMLDAIIFDNNLIHEGVHRELQIWKSTNTEDIDEKDKIILHTLNKNGKETLVNLAAKAKLSMDATSKRIKKLNEKKIIAFYNANINYNILGYEKYKVFIDCRDYSEEFEKELLHFLKTKKNFLNIIKTIGPWKIEVEFLTEKYDEFQKIASELQEKFSKYVSKLDFSIFRNEIWFPSENLLI